MALELADLYEKDKQPAEAIAIYREFPENAAARRLGELLLETKEYTGAIPSRRGLRQEPTQENRVALALAYVSTNSSTRRCRCSNRRWRRSRPTTTCA